MKKNIRILKIKMFVNFGLLFFISTLRFAYAGPPLVDINNNLCEDPFYDKIVMGFAGGAGERFILAAYPYGPKKPPKSLWLDTSKPYDPTLAPYTAPNPSYAKGTNHVDYIYTTNQYGPSIDIHVSRPYGGIGQIGDGVEGGPFRSDVNNWGDVCDGFNFPTLEAYHKFAENCHECGPDRGHHGVMDLVHLWAYKAPFDGLLKNMSEVFEVPLTEDSHEPNTLMVGDQTGIRQSDGKILRKSNLIDVANYASQHSDMIDISYESEVTKLDIEREKDGKLHVVRVHYTKHGKPKTASLKRKIVNIFECLKLGLPIYREGIIYYCVQYGEIYNGLGWEATPTIAKRSGLGPSEELLSQGITPILDIPNLGKFEGDYTGPAMVWAVQDPDLVGKHWFLFAAFTKDVQAAMLYSPATFGSPVDLLVAPLYHAKTSYTGYVKLRSASTGMNPVISANITLTPELLDDFRYMVDSLREVMGRNPQLYEQVPGFSVLPANYTNEQLTTFIKSSFRTRPHYSGSAKCPDIVGPDGKWNGINGLYSVGSQDFFPKMPGQPHWIYIAVSTKLGCEAAERWGGIGCNVV